MKNLFKDKVVVGMVVGLVTVLLLIAGILLYPVLFNSVKALDYTNLTQKEVVDWYKEQFGDQEGLKIIYEYSETVEKDHVIKQSVKPGEKIEDVLKITVSKGPDPEVEFELPDFVKEKYDRTKIEAYFLENKFLDVTYEYKVDKKAPKDLVIAVNKKGKVKRGEPILVTLSINKDVSELKVKVVDLTKYSLTNAKKWASSNAIDLDITYKFSDKAKGTILSQSIAANTTIKGGSTIKIEVSKGKAVEVVNVIGISEANATSKLRGLNLNVSVAYEYSKTVEKGLVISQNPGAGSKVEEDSTVSIVVSKGKNPADVYVEVANMAGKSESELINHINQLGLKYKKGTGYYSDSLAAGLVYSNDNGKYNMLSTINYHLSLGAYSFSAGEYNGKSVDSVNGVISKYNKLNAGISFNINPIEINGDNYNVTSNCSYGNKTVTCDVGRLAYIMSPTTYIGASVKETQDSINSLLGVYFNVSFKYDTSGVYNDGYITSMSVGGSTTYNVGYYEAGTSIVVTIAKN